MNYYHLSELIHLQAKQFGDEEVLRFRNEISGQWSSISWKEFSQRVMIVAQTLCHIGAKPQSNIGVYTQNRLECFFIDFAAFANRAAIVPMYATASIPQIAYMIKEAEIEILFVGDQTQYDNAYEVQKESTFLKKLIILDPQVRTADEDKTSIHFEAFCSHKNRTSQDMTSVEKRMNMAQDDDIAHILYTSGTTGEPKGVVLTHANYKAVMKTHDDRLSYLPERFLSMSFLPLAHVFEKAWSIYCLHRACCIAISFDPREIQTYVKEVKPEAMCGVPRFWEKVYAGVQEKIESSSYILKKLFLRAISVGKRHNLDYVNNEKKPPFFLRIRFQFYNKLIFNTLKKVIGIENGIIFPTAGAALAENINIFLQSVNIPIRYGYGLTETTATVACFPQIGFEMGTVGKIMPATEVRIGEDNEIQVRADSIMKEYYKKPKETAKAFTPDGFFRTGDAGYLTEKQGIVLTERIKDLYKTSNGKYIAPQQLEARLMADKYIESAIIIADQRKYVTALIIPDFIEIKKYAESLKLVFDTPAELYRHQTIIDFINQRIQLMQNEFASYEQIKRFSILSEPFTIQSGELTNTLKVKRAFIAEKYRDEIEKMYS